MSERHCNIPLKICSPGLVVAVGNNEVTEISGVVVAAQERVELVNTLQVGHDA